MKKPITLMLCALACWTYSPRLLSDNAQDVVVHFSDDTPRASSYFNSFRNIPLSAPSDEAVFKHAERLLFARGRIFVVDRVGNKILMFDEKGDFLKSTAKMIGDGDHAYRRVIDAAVDAEGGKLYVHCDAPYQMMILDLDLNVKEVIPMDYYMSEMTIDDGFVYGLCHHTKEKKNIGYSLVAVPKDRLDEAPDTLLSHDKGVAGLLAGGKSLNACSDGVYASLAFDNTIYHIAHGKILNQYAIDFGEKGLRAHPIPEGMNREQFREQYKDINWAITNVCGSDSILMFNTNLTTNYILNKHTGECKGVKAFGCDMSKWTMSHFTPSQGLRHGMVYAISPFIFSEFKKFVQEEGAKLVDPEMLKTAQESKPGGNPMLIVWEIK